MHPLFAVIVRFCEPDRLVMLQGETFSETGDHLDFGRDDCGRRVRSRYRSAQQLLRGL